MSIIINISITVIISIIIFIIFFIITNTTGTITTTAFIIMYM